MHIKYQKALKELSQNDSIIVTTADKGGKVVVMDSIQYAEIVLNHLEDPVYEEIQEFGNGTGYVDLTSTVLLNENLVEMDPLDKMLRLQCQELITILNSLKRRRQVSDRERKALSPKQPFSGIMPKFYGLPKLHKLGLLTIRPIISNLGLYSDDLMLTLKPVLNLLLWGSTTLCNSYELVQLLSDVEFGPNDRLMSFDVKSLYT